MTAPESTDRVRGGVGQALGQDLDEFHRRIRVLADDAAEQVGGDAQDLESRLGGGGGRALAFAEHRDLAADLVGAITAMVWLSVTPSFSRCTVISIAPSMMR